MTDDRWSVTTDVSWTTPFSISVTVQRPGLADVTASYPWALDAGPAARHAVVSQAPVSGWLKWGSALLLALAGLAGAVYLLRRPRRFAPTVEARSPEDALVGRR
jgi:hypothetical protein